jgi:molybdate transport system substrate-binding protein
MRGGVAQVAPGSPPDSDSNAGPSTAMSLLGVLLLSAGCAHGADLLVAAASDLAPLAASIEKGYQNATRPATAQRVRFTFASSGSLAQQIKNGAPFDLFLSADARFVSDLTASGQLDAATVVTYATGRIALWSASGDVRSLADLRKPAVTHIAIANPEHAPYGAAARAALENQGLWRDIQSKLVYGENVRQALQFAESRNAEAVITSWTLLLGRGILLPASWHPAILQAGAVVKASPQSENARGFLRFLTSEAGRKILQAGGLFPAQQP